MNVTNKSCFSFLATVCSYCCFMANIWIRVSFLPFLCSSTVVSISALRWRDFGPLCVTRRHSHKYVELPHLEVFSLRNSAQVLHWDFEAFRCSNNNAPMRKDSEQQMKLLPHYVLVVLHLDRSWGGQDLLLHDASAPCQSDLSGKVS